MDSNTPDASFSTLLLVQSRIFEAIASSTMLTGALQDLARQFDVAPDDFLACLDGLDHAGWVAVSTAPESQMRIRLAY